MSLQVDAERVTSAFLRGRSAITALVSQRVYTDLPKDPTFPLVRITLLDTTGADEDVDWLDGCALQIDCYGGTHRDAQQLAATVNEQLRSMPGASLAEGVCTGVRFRSRGRYLPDVSYAPAKPRVITEPVVYLHP